MDSIKKSFILYSDSLKVLNLLTDAQAGILFRKIYEQVLNPNEDIGITIEDLSIQIAFINIQNYLAEDQKKYQNVVQRNRENGKNGGRPMKPKITQETQVVIPETQNNPKNLDTDTGTGTDTGTELDTGTEINITSNLKDNNVTKLKEKKGKEKKVGEVEIAEQPNTELEEIVEFYNSVFNKRIESTNGFKDNYLYWRKFHTLDKIKAAIQSSYNDRFWRDKMTLSILFRLKNPHGEKVDYIEDLSNRSNQKPVGGVAVI